MIGQFKVASLKSLMMTHHLRREAARKLFFLFFQKRFPQMIHTPNDRFPLPNDRYLRPNDRFLLPNYRSLWLNHRYVRPNDGYLWPNDRYLPNASYVSPNE